MNIISINQINEHLEKVPGWGLEDNGKSITRVFEFQEFMEAVGFINKVAQVSEQEKHHPNLKLYDYNKVEVTLTTHSVDGLTEKDFNIASKINNLKAKK